MDNLVQEQSTLVDQLIRIGLIFGAIFQLICIAAVIIFPSSHHETGESGDSASSDEDITSPDNSYGLMVSRVWSSGHSRGNRSNRKKRK